ncbi:MAG: amino acid permease [Gemmatimonadota bacterium]
MAATGAPRLKKQLTLFDVYVVAVGPMLSSGFFLLPGLAAAGTGPSVILAYFLAGFFVLPAMLSQAELATAMPRAGGTYYFLDRSLGPMVGTVGGLGTWLVLVLKSAFALIGMGAYLALFTTFEIKPLAVGLTLLFSLIAIMGTKGSSRLQRGLVVVVLGLVAVFIVAGLASVFGTRGVQISSDDFRPFLTHGGEGLFATIGLVFISYAGLTKVASVSEEVRNPDRNLPLGMALAILTASAIYVVGVFLIVAALEPEVLYDTFTPVVDAGLEFMNWLPRPVAMVLLVTPALAGLAAAGNAGILAASRYPLAMARDKLIPSPFAMLSRFGTPVLGIVATAVLIVAGILTLDVLTVAKLASTFQLLIFALLNLAVIVMRESRLEAYDPGYRSPLYPWVQIFGLLSPILLIAVMGLMPIVFAIALVGVCLGWFFFYARDRVVRDGAVFHWFERLGERRFEGLDTELRDIMKEKGVREGDPFDELIAMAAVLELSDSSTFEDAVHSAAALLSERIAVPAKRLSDGFLRGTKMGATPVAHGAALPHLRLAEAEFPQLVLARCRAGMAISVGDQFADNETHGEQVYAIFFLVSSEENPGQHLRLLAQIAGRVDDEGFMEEWLSVEHERELKRAILRNERFLSLRLADHSPSEALIGRKLMDLDIPEGVLIALIRREGQHLIPRGQTELQSGDRLTIVGDPEGIGDMAARYGESGGS